MTRRLPPFTILVALACTTPAAAVPVLATYDVGFSGVTGAGWVTHGTFSAVDSDGDGVLRLGEVNAFEAYATRLDGAPGQGRRISRALSHFAVPLLSGRLDVGMASDWVVHHACAERYGAHCIARSAEVEGADGIDLGGDAMHMDWLETVTLDNVVPTPLPAAWVGALLGFGALGLTARRS